jgi:hypothetical protein
LLSQKKIYISYTPGIRTGALHFQRNVTCFVQMFLKNVFLNVTHLQKSVRMRNRTCAQYDRSYVLNVLQNVTHLIYKKVFECGIEPAHNMIEVMY